MIKWPLVFFMRVFGELVRKFGKALCAFVQGISYLYVHEGSRSSCSHRRGTADSYRSTIFSVHLQRGLAKPIYQRHAIGFLQSPMFKKIACTTYKRKF